MAARIEMITMPKWGMTMTEGKVASWRIGEGGDVAPGAEIIEIETTKITNVLETPSRGVLRRQVVATGETAAVGALLGVVADSSVPEAEIEAFVAEHSRRAVEQAEPSAPAARLVKVGASDLNVLSMGQGRGLPVVLVHGFGGSLDSWLFNQPALAEQRTVHAIDLPAHGGSPITDVSGGVPVLARAVLAALDTLGATKVHFVGHSLGGAVGLFIARTAPARLASLTLIAPGGVDPEINLDYLRGFATADSRKSMKDVLGLLFGDADKVSRDMVDASLRYKRQDGAPEALQALLGAMLDGDRQRGSLRNVLMTPPVPILLIWGTQDRIIPVAQAQGLPAAVAVRLFDGAGHMPQMEAAAEVNRLIGDHIQASEG